MTITAARPIVRGDVQPIRARRGRGTAPRTMLPVSRAAAASGQFPARASFCTPHVSRGVPLPPRQDSAFGLPADDRGLPSPKGKVRSRSLRRYTISSPRGPLPMDMMVVPVKCSMMSSRAQTLSGSATGCCWDFHHSERAKMGVSRQPCTFLRIGSQ
eukprot:scaffold15540_cov31-Tisochrysis_lutea.AAC.3